jgi:hypothetical protein
VSDLIDPLTDQWDIALLGTLFNTVDVNRIPQIPIHPEGFSDFIAWRHTSHGRYTVRSGYHCQWHHMFGASAGQLALPGSSATNTVFEDSLETQNSEQDFFLSGMLYTEFSLLKVFLSTNILVTAVSVRYAILRQRIYSIYSSNANLQAQFGRL